MNLGTSRHRTVSLVLSDGIATGRYRLGESLPGEEALAKMFQVSRVTIRRALADLIPGHRRGFSVGSFADFEVGSRAGGRRFDGFSGLGLALRSTSGGCHWNK